MKSPRLRALPNCQPHNAQASCVIHESLAPLLPFLFSRQTCNFNDVNRLPTSSTTEGELELDQKSIFLCFMFSNRNSYFGQFHSYIIWKILKERKLLQQRKRSCRLHFLQFFVDFCRVDVHLLDHRRYTSLQMVCHHNKGFGLLAFSKH